MKKKTAVILAVVLLVSLFAFTGCADDEDGLSDSDQGSASQDIAEGADDIGDGIEKGAEDIGDDLTGDNKNADGIQSGGGNRAGACHNNKNLAGEL